ncbi:MAG: SDR family NAD(P)-dependent oxidoreductase [Betaproteobacteria bacterium]
MASAVTLAGKHALVTGGGTGIGAAIALALAERGATVTVCGRRLSELQASAKRHVNIHAQTADVTDADSLLQLYRGAQAARGSFDIVVANAGVAESAPAEKVSRALWDHTIAVNLTGAFLSVQPALAAMRERKWGRIVFIASTAGLKAYAYVAPYVAAKHGVIGLTRALAIETAKAGITVNAVCPGYAETPMLERAIDRITAATRRSNSEARGALAANSPQARFIKPEEVAAAVVWLCGEDSAAITGQAISVSGGETW